MGEAAAVVLRTEPSPVAEAEEPPAVPALVHEPVELPLLARSVGVDDVVGSDDPAHLVAALAFRSEADLRAVGRPREAPSAGDAAPRRDQRPVRAVRRHRPDPELLVIGS